MFQTFQSTFYNLIKEADQFGAVFRPSLRVKNQYYKTIYGGIISIIVYGLSMSYFVFGIHQWATNQILPNIVDSYSLNEIVSYQSSEKLISIQYDFENGIIDPFDTQNIVLMVVTQYYNDAYPSSNFTRVKQTDGQFNVENFSLYLDYSDRKNKTNQECFLFIIPCDQQYLEDGEQCASEDQRQQFWDQQNFLVVKFYLQQYDTRSRSLSSLYRLFYIYLNEDLTFINSLYLQQTKTTVDTGILFPDFKQFNFISDIFQQSQSTSFLTSLKLYDFPAYFSLYITMESLQPEQSISFANISSVLANIGSIISSLLALKYIAIFINQDFLEDEAIHDIIKMFYPEFNDIIIKKTWLGKIKSVKNKKQNLYYKVDEYIQYYNRLSQVAEQKLCMSNMIFELSRLQFAIQQLLPKDELINLRDKYLQIKLQAQNQIQRDTDRIQPSFRQQQLSDDREAAIKKISEINDIDQGLQQIVIDDAQNKLNNNQEIVIDDPQNKQNKNQEIVIDDPQNKFNNYQEIDLFEDDFDIFCLNNYQFMKK